MGNSISKNRYIDTSFWDDEWITELDPSEKLLYIYLLTNPLTNISGIYKLTRRRICFDTGFNETTVNYIFQKFESAKKVFRCGEYVILKSWCKHQTWEKSGNVRQGIMNCLEEVPTDVLVYACQNGFKFDLTPILKQRGYDMYTLSRGMQEASMTSNYLNSNLNLNNNLNSHTHTKLEQENSEKQTETQILENQEDLCTPESACDSESSSLPDSVFETQGFSEHLATQCSEQQQKYARAVYDIWEKADLPRPRSGYLTFLMRDFYAALPELRRQKLHSNDVIQACMNYAKVIALNREGKSWWESKSSFDNFARQNVIKRFLPDYFDLESFVKSPGNRSPIGGLDGKISLEEN